MPTKTRASLPIQTSLSGYRAGWRFFRAWERRFRQSARRGRNLEPIDFDDVLYLADRNTIDDAESDFDQLEVERPSDEVRYQKLAFLRAYLAMMSLEQRSFEKKVRQLLRYQTRLSAPNLIGVWFWQNEIEKFGYGASTLFQGVEASLFCKSLQQIDFADISAIQPFDHITLRHPTGNWTPAEADRAMVTIKEDLEFDGISAKNHHWLEGRLLQIQFIQPEYGTDLTPQRLRAYRSAEFYGEVFGKT